ncbi:hypothetical protein [Streptomyces sp. CC208A]|uniref:hypothetical protein n=1 Tax=Streptomyces sp. CC208A TaxID=3044573 RepID=UPI0024A7F9E6|nr:hypothetical protein [Streptomyces sp. CC208A]
MRPRTAPLLLLLLAVTGCGTVTAGGTPPPPPDRSALEARARHAQIRVEHVYVTEAEGYAPALQSAGVVGDDGFQIVYVREDGGGNLTLTAERRPFRAEECVAGPAKGDSCVAEGDGWYRRTGEQHAYLRNENGLRVEVAAPLTVPRDLLRQAAAKAHRADDTELDAVLPKSTGGGPPVERGDLPPVGDGAPDNAVGASG